MWIQVDNALDSPATRTKYAQPRHVGKPSQSKHAEIWFASSANWKMEDEGSTVVRNFLSIVAINATIR